MLESMTQRGQTQRRRGRGLTLIEVTVALAVLAIVASMAVPSLAARVARQRLVSAAEELALDLAQARFEASRSGRPLYLHFRPGADWCYAVASAGGCACDGSDSCQVKVVRAADAPGVTLVAADDAGFAPDATSFAPAAIELSGAGDGLALRVDVSRLGRARICTPGTVPGYPAC